LITVATSKRCALQIISVSIAVDERHDDSVRARESYAKELAASILRIASYSS
jgi:hypothetical protein